MLGYAKAGWKTDPSSTAHDLKKECDLRTPKLLKRSESR